MKKAIVMEKHRHFTIVMTEDGMFQKAKPIKNASVGSEVTYELIGEKKHILFLFHPRKINKPFRLIAMACLLLLIVMPFYFISDSNETYAYVNVDINPSVELEVDEDLQVHSILPLNDDAKSLVKELVDYQGESLGEVISRIMDKSEEKGLIKNGKNVIVGVSYVDSRSNEISVLDTIDRFFTEHQTDWKTATFQVPKDVRDSAKEKEKSMNELMAASITEDSSLDDNETDKHKRERMNDEERAIINSFYNKDKDKTKEVKSVQQAEERIKSVNEETSYTNQHPNELKGKNGTIHSNKKNHKKKVNKKEKHVVKEKHKKEKHANKDHSEKNKHEKHRNKHDNGKQRHGNNGNDKQKHKDNNGHKKQKNKHEHKK